MSDAKSSDFVIRRPEACHRTRPPQGSAHGFPQNLPDRLRPGHLHTQMPSLDLLPRFDRIEARKGSGTTSDLCQSAGLSTPSPLTGRGKTHHFDWREVLGARLDDRYEVIRSLGRGGMSEVYLARDLVSAQVVALKVVAPELWGSPQIHRQFLTEATTTSRISHPNVVRLIDYDAAPTRVPYLVFEWLQGETLRAYLNRNKTMPERLVVDLMVQAAAGLEAAHEQQIIHCDIKPDNLFLCGPPGRATALKILDFGLARHQGAGFSPGHETIAGTFEYMAPEQIVAEPVDPRADVYALGVVMFRALTGELPFDTSPATRLVGHHLFSPAPPPSWLADGLDPKLESVVLRAMRKHPQNRYPTMQQFANDLERVRAGLDVTAPPHVHQPDLFRPVSDAGREVLDVLSRSPSFSVQLPRPGHSERRAIPGVGLPETDSGLQASS